MSWREHQCGECENLPKHGGPSIGAWRASRSGQRSASIPGIDLSDHGLCNIRHAAGMRRIGDDRQRCARFLRLFLVQVGECRVQPNSKVLRSQIGGVVKRGQRVRGAVIGWLQSRIDRRLEGLAA